MPGAAAPTSTSCGTAEDQPLLGRRDALLLLHPLLDARDRVVALNVDLDLLASQRFDLDLPPEQAPGQPTGLAKTRVRAWLCGAARTFMAREGGWTVCGGSQSASLHRQVRRTCQAAGSFSELWPPPGAWVRESVAWPRALAGGARPPAVLAGRRAGQPGSEGERVRRRLHAAEQRRQRDSDVRGSERRVAGGRTARAAAQELEELESARFFLGERSALII